MSMTPGFNSSAEPPDASSSAELTPPTNRRRVLIGVAVPVAAILSWILASATDHIYWYGLVAIVAVVCGALYRSSAGYQPRNRNRNRAR